MIRNGVIAVVQRVKALCHHQPTPAGKPNYILLLGCGKSWWGPHLREQLSAVSRDFLEQVKLNNRTNTSLEEDKLKS